MCDMTRDVDVIYEINIYLAIICFAIRISGWDVFAFAIGLYYMKCQKKVMQFTNINLFSNNSKN